MKYTARKPFRYGNKIYMAGDGVPASGDDVKMLQGQGKIGAPIMEKPKVETAMAKPIETAMKPKAEPSHNKIEPAEEREEKKPKPRKRKKKESEAGD